MSYQRVLRLGLFQLAAGATSVIFLGVVNRVMRVELGLDLFVVSLLVGGGHYLGAVVAIPFGYFSDRHTLGGYRRSVYALGGALITALLLGVSPFVAVWLSHNQTVLGFSLGFGFFLLEGLSTYIAGTAYLALIADLTDEKQRGQATAVVWTLLMVGIILTDIGAGVILQEYSFAAFVSLTLIGAMTAAGLAAVALVRQEPRAAQAAAPAPTSSLRASLAALLQNSPARWFGLFLLLSLFSYFMQDVILEPFGGEVFGLTAAQTARFNAYMGVGVVAGMMLGGMALIPRYGKPIITMLGCGLQALAFGLLAYASVAGQPGWLSLSIGGLGFGAGLFTVGGVALMMDMTTARQTGLFVGAWTLVQAVAKGPAAIAGGALQTAFTGLVATAAQAYAGVFSVQGLGLMISIALLARVGVRAFRQEARSSLTTAVAQALD